MQEIKDYLILFNEKTSKLLALNYSKKTETLDVVFTSENGISLYLCKNGDFQDPTNQTPALNADFKSGVSVTGPVGEEFDSFILNLRFFIQNNDILSISNWNKQIHSPFITKRHQERADELRDDLNQILDSPVLNTKLSTGRIVLTSREIINLYVYGEYAHTNQEKQKLYREIGFNRGDNLSFILSTKQVCQSLRRVEELNVEILEYLSDSHLKKA